MNARRFVAGLLAAGSLIGCAQEVGDETIDRGAPARTGAVGEAERAPVETRVVNARRARVSMDAPAAWDSRALGAWTLHEAPGGLVVLAYVEIGPDDAIPARLEEAAAAAGATELRLASEHTFPIGADELPARAASGTCRLDDRGAKVQYAVVDAGSARLMIVQFVAEGASRETAQAAMAAVGSLRRQ